MGATLDPAAAPAAIRAWLDDARPVIEAAIEARLPRPPADADPGRLTEAMRYAALGAGKRLRPALVLAAHDAAGGTARDRAIAAAVAVELLHAYTLVHDDLPAMDDDSERRGRPTVHVAFGEAIAILAGDALLTEAFRQVLSYPTPEPAQVLADATAGMIGGQYVDITTNGNVGHDELVALHRLKTGRLLAACVGCALAVAGLPEEARVPWRAFADDVGLLFQIVDDILDATGTADELGKTPGKDEAEGKATYVTLHGLEQARALADETRARVMDRLDAIPADTSVLADLVDQIRERRS
jgi:geranylgeranyl pyrophosphate synthase